MSEASVPEVGSLRAVDAAGLVDLVTGCAAAAARAEAVKLAAIAEFWDAAAPGPVPVGLF
ncbi:hypothetical protein H7H73_23600 [Mycobacterium rufum]|uniref:Uncharacterized protein n=1 Tax=Mycolicibacterium rufum TaxID=318424 RepID=A0A9X2YGL0_9MYCO|nr:hypothetical protein [Mycolicibacterium rufum]